MWGGGGVVVNDIDNLNNVIIIIIIIIFLFYDCVTYSLGSDEALFITHVFRFTVPGS